MDRKFVSQMLNSTFEYRWRVAPDGAVRVDSGSQIRQFTSFDGLTKHADSFQLDEIIEIRLRREAQKRKLAKLEAKRKARLKQKLSSRL